MITQTKHERVDRRTPQQIASEIAVLIGDEFFKSMATHIGIQLDATCILVGEFVGGTLERVKTLAIWFDRDLSIDLYYPLAGGICASIAVGDQVVCLNRIGDRFPTDALLEVMPAEAGIAVPLFDVNHAPSGVIMALFGRRLTNPRLAKSMLETFAPRASVELQRRQAEAALRASEERHKVFVEENPDAMWRIELEHPISIDVPVSQQIDELYQYAYLAECNNAMAKYMGAERPSQIVGMRFAALTARADANLWEHIRVAIGNGYRFSTIETTPIDERGVRRYYLRTHLGIVESGMLRRIWGTIRDVTDLRRIEMRIQASERHLTDLLESVHLLAVMVDAGGSVTFCNDYVLKITQLTSEEVIGQNWFELMFPEEEQSRVRAIFKSLLSNSLPPCHFESVLAGTDGARSVIAWDVAALCDADGNTQGCVGVGREISIGISHLGSVH